MKNAQLRCNFFLDEKSENLTELRFSILMHIDGSGNGYGDVDEYGGHNDDDNDGSNVYDSTETIMMIITLMLNKGVNLPGLLSLCSSYISYSYFLRVPVILANLRVNISHNNPNITGSWKKSESTICLCFCLSIHVFIYVLILLCLRVFHYQFHDLI